MCVVVAAAFSCWQLGTANVYQQSQGHNIYIYIERERETYYIDLKRIDKRRELRECEYWATVKMRQGTLPVVVEDGEIKMNDESAKPKQRQNRKLMNTRQLTELWSMMELDKATVKRRRKAYALAACTRRGWRHRRREYPRLGNRCEEL